MAKRNPIVEADYDEGEELSLDDFEEGEFDPDEADEETDEDVEAALAEMEEAQRRQVQQSRQRGKAPSKGVRKGHQTPAQKVARARAPARQREVLWEPANTLDAPPARPGMEQRWIRFQLADKDDPRNMSRKLRERWAPRKLDTVTEDYAPPTLKHGQMGTVIGVGDLILCERPAEIGRARKKFFRDKAARQQAAAARHHVDKVMRGDHPITVHNPTEAPTVGRGTRRRAPVQEE